VCLTSNNSAERTRHVPESPTYAKSITVAGMVQNVLICITAIFQLFLDRLPHITLSPLLTITLLWEITKCLLGKVQLEVQSSLHRSTLT